MVVWNSHVNILASLIFNSYAWVFVKSCSFHIYITCYLCWAHGSSMLWHILVVRSLTRSRFILGKVNIFKAEVSK
jgi:hypothetical protein